ncbi:MAG: tRNA preQ1(34) S-adenosylmethionine ribosyltransferase-isomerase QueA [Gemmatimonadetes bacterium]|nr:tRNA preQ1(34) S-adenosylmethionine ribosyltransferase-isomerase QueA [Gemmatimonadota bacterium]
MSGGGRRVSEYDYDLPEGRIARYPAQRRDESRLLVVPGGGGDLGHMRFRDLPDLVRPGDVLVVNESRVLPVRLLGSKPTGAPSEILLLRPTPRADADDPREWEALVRPGGKLKPGRRVLVADDLAVDVVDSLEGGGRVVRLDTPLPALEAIERHGHVPLPPYLGREDEPLDRERYQTVYARVPGSVAAPTAGLHFTPALLDALEARGVRRVAVTLDVGVGTFRPVDAEDPAEHDMHAERYRVEPEAARAINEARAAGGRCWAVGTTVVRTLETLADGRGVVRAGAGSTRLFIRPPYRFRAVDALVTNFHLPRSTLLMLVAAFGGYDRVMEAYRVAVREGYRFYSYGDAMALLPDPDRAPDGSLAPPG